MICAFELASRAYRSHYPTIYITARVGRLTTSHLFSVDFFTLVTVSNLLYLALLPLRYLFIVTFLPFYVMSRQVSFLFFSLSCVD